ncbi:cdt1-like protein chloroplastic-like, partial [Trifolium pratense]
FKPAKRVLDFSLTEGSDDLDNRVDMSKPSRGCSENFKSFDSSSLLQEVPENLYYSLEKINQNDIGLDASDDNSSSLVELVNVIDSIFSSVKRTSITKEELLQKIMMNCLDFVEISEVEEQIEILEKIVPDWICKKLVSSGDTVYCIKNAVDLESIRSRLLNNVTKGVE